jgi:tRNA-dihydrouridine synthase
MRAAHQLAELGYNEINLNLGCPSGTVTAKYKGAGFLQLPDELDAFFDEVYSCLARELPHVSLSVKTRVGYEREEEAATLLAVYNRYPISELIVHPRLRMDFYRGKPRMAAFDLFASESRTPVCYNGDIFTVQDYRDFCARYPNISRVMIGRGAIATPALLAECKGTAFPDKKSTLRGMHDAILAANLQVMGEGRNLICRMADIWNYQIYQFTTDLRAAREMHRATTLAEYRAAVVALFRAYPVREDAVYIPPQSR